MKKSKFCLQCNKKVVGRPDKKFCSDKCRANFFYHEKSEYNKFRKKINDIILKNREILANLNPEGKTIVHKRELENRKFNFHYFTTYYKAKNGNVYWFCYDYGFCKMQTNNNYIIVKWQPYMS